MSKVYVVMVDDRHADVEPHLFADEATALIHAYGFARELECATQDTPDGWLFLACHEEGDSVWVVEKEIRS